MLDFLSIIIWEVFFWTVVKPVGVLWRWARSGFRRPIQEIWNDHPRTNFPAGALVVFGLIAAIGVFHIIRDMRLS